MKFYRPLDELLGQQSKVKLLRFLAKTRAEMAGRELSRAVGLAQRIAHSALMDLWKLGVVRMRRVGRAKLYKLNTKHALVSDVLLPIFSYEEELLPRLAGRLAKTVGKDIVSAVLFGSIAEGREQPDSDIDLLLVIKESANQAAIAKKLDGLILQVSEKYGNLLSPTLLKASQFKKRYRQKDKFVRGIVNKGKVIFGKAFMETLYA